MNTFSFIAAILFSLSSLMWSTSAIAQNAGRWYQVEILVFKRSFETANNELWDKDLRLSYPENTRYIQKTLPNAAHYLGGHNYTLKKSGQYEVLFHNAWNQQMWKKDESPAFVIRGGASYGTHRELEGTIRIHIGRYLHVTTDLWLSDFISKTSAITSSGSGLSLPRLPNAVSASTGGFYPSRIVALRETRRMRSKETHYIDHPLMGVLVHMIPIEAPSANKD